MKRTEQNWTEKQSQKWVFRLVKYNKLSTDTVVQIGLRVWAHNWWKRNGRTSLFDAFYRFQNKFNHLYVQWVRGGDHFDAMRIRILKFFLIHLPAFHFVSLFLSRIRKLNLIEN